MGDTPEKRGPEDNDESERRPRSGIEVKAAIGKEGEAVAKDAVKTDKPKEDQKPEKKDDEKKAPAEQDILPDNEWSRTYYDLKAQMDAPGSQLKGPLSAFALAFLKLAAKYCNYMDLMPGRFETTISESDDFKDKTLSEEQLKKLNEKLGKLDANGNIVFDKAAEEKASKELTDLAKTEEAAGRKLGKERASTRFAANALLGVDDIEDSTTFAASLIHTKKITSDGISHSLYSISKFDNLRSAGKDGIKPGTVIIFVPDLKSAEKIVAYATGNKDEFKYFDAAGSDSKVVTFKLSDPNCPVKEKVGLMTVLEPNFMDYRNAVDVPVTPDQKKPEEKAPLNPEELRVKAIKKIEDEQSYLSKQIAEYQASKDGDVSALLIIKNAASESLAGTEKLVKDLEAEMAKMSAEDRTKVQKYYERAQELVKTARNNKDAADKLVEQKK